MGKIDFSKVEASLSQALHSMFIKKIIDGKPSVSSRAASFYRLDKDKGAKPTDPVIAGLEELQQATEESETKETGLFEEESRPKEGTLPEIPSMEPPPPEEKEEVVSEEIKMVENASSHFPLQLILKKHLIFFIRRKIAIYGELKMSKESVLALLHKETLSAEDEALVKKLVDETTKLKEEVLKKAGVDTTDALIEQERKRHRTKRYNTKDTWLPL